MKSLYYYETEDNIPIYFVEDNNTLVKIDAPKLSKQATNIQFKGQTDRYIPLLHYAFKDCPSLAPQIDRARFSRKEMIKITKNIIMQCVPAMKIALNLKQKKINVQYS